MTTVNGNSVVMDIGRGHLYWSGDVSPTTINRAAVDGFKREVVIGKLCTVLYTHALMS